MRPFGTNLWGAVLVVAACLAGASRADVPAVPVLPDTSGPEFKAIVEQHGKAQEAEALARRESLEKLLRQRIEEAEEQLKERKKARNVTGIAVASNAREVFGAALTNLQASGSFELPAKVRRELEPVLAEFNATRQRVEADSAAAKARIRKEHVDRFRALVLKAGPGRQGEGESLIEARFDEMVSGKYAGTTPRGEAGAPAGRASATNAPASAATNEPPPILGSSGEAAVWATVARWKGDMSGLDVVGIPVFEMQKGTNSQTHFNPIRNENSRWEYVAEVSMVPTSGMVFRLKRVADRLGVEPVEWPSERNSQMLSVRVPAADGERLPAFDLQVALPGRDPGAAFAGMKVEATEQPAGKTPSAILLSIQTTPAGAAVWVDDQPVRDIRTPCRVRVPGGAHRLRLALPGYIPAVFSNQIFSVDRSIKWMFQPDPRVVRKSFTVSAGADGWTTEGIRVAKGDTLNIEVDGTWSCGKGKELCDALGYPNNESFFAYYMDGAEHPRQFIGANYGALLMRIGEGGRPMAVGRSFRITAPSDGQVFFDINEIVGRSARGDNGSALMVKITVMPSDPAPF